jgi:hypothetical protein
MFAAFMLLSPIYVLVTWLVYLGAKWAAALMVASPVDQAIMGVIAVCVFAGTAIAAIIERTRD